MNCVIVGAVCVCTQPARRTHTFGFLSTLLCVAYSSCLDIRKTGPWTNTISIKPALIVGLNEWALSPAGVGRPGTCERDDSYKSTQ